MRIRSARIRSVRIRSARISSARTRSVRTRSVRIRSWHDLSLLYLLACDRIEKKFDVDFCYKWVDHVQETAKQVSHRVGIQVED